MVQRIVACTRSYSPRICQFLCGSCWRFQRPQEQRKCKLVFPEKYNIEGYSQLNNDARYEWTIVQYLEAVPQALNDER
jgi:hypothetical protein